MRQPQAMTPEQFWALKPGDVIRHVAGSDGYIVVKNDGRSVVAVREISLTNPTEWILVHRQQQ